MQHEHQQKAGPEDWIRGALEARQAQHLFRETRCYTHVGGIIRAGDTTQYNFCSNDYLDLAGSKAGSEAASAWAAQLGHGATASRLVCGTLPCHEEVEQRLAAFKGYPTALLFGSGYLTNLGVIPALVNKFDAVFADRLAHASIIDGVRLSGARLHRFHHNDPGHLDKLLSKHPDHPRKLVITESLFSMDGDLAPLTELAEGCEKHGAMFMVDEAHATGVFGPQGRGLITESSLQQRVHISMGTLSKALGSYGGFVCCSDDMRSYLVNHARPFIYSTALPPNVLAPVISALDLLESDGGEPARLLERSIDLRRRLNDAGIDTGDSQSPIIPLMVGDAETALAIENRLREQQFFCAAIRPPTVPAGTSRLRLTVTLAHDEAAIDRVASRVMDAFREFKLIA